MELVGYEDDETRSHEVFSFGTVHLEPNQKLEEITWKDDSLWYLTRPMMDNDIAETHTFQQSSNFGVFEGTVIIIESKSE